MNIPPPPPPLPLQIEVKNKKKTVEDNNNQNDDGIIAYKLKGILKNSQANNEIIPQHTQQIDNLKKTISKNSLGEILRIKLSNSFGQELIQKDNSLKTSPNPSLPPPSINQNSVQDDNNFEAFINNKNLPEINSSLALTAEYFVRLSLEHQYALARNLCVKCRPKITKIYLYNSNNYFSVGCELRTFDNINYFYKDGNYGLLSKGQAALTTNEQYLNFISQKKMDLYKVDEIGIYITN